MATSTSRSSPKYRRQKGKNRKADRAFVELEGRRFYLAEYGSEESRQRFHQLVGEWMDNHLNLPIDAEHTTIVELIARFWIYAKDHYRKPNGEPTTSLGNYRPCLQVLEEVYGPTSVVDFGPRALKTIRQRLIDKGCCRTYVNKQTNMIRSVLKWRVAEELVPPSVLQALQAVPAGLKQGRCDAPERPPATRTRGSRGRHQTLREPPGVGLGPVTVAHRGPHWRAGHHAAD